MTKHVEALRSAGMLVLLAILLCLLPRSALAGMLDIQRPGPREFVVDYANILDEAAEREIREVAADLLDQHVTSIVVVTIESMAAHGGERMEVDTFARILFDQWGVGHRSVNGETWDTGILLVISKQDRKARIELGTGWAHNKDAEAQRIMDSRIIPAFKQGDHSRGTVAGVHALDAMARSKPLPLGERYDWRFYLWVAFAGFVLLLVLKSLITSGRDGWGWKLIVFVFTVLGAIFMVLALFGGRERSCRGGSLSSFGGGRSGGGGATGSW